MRANLETKGKGRESIIRIVEKSRRMKNTLHKLAIQSAHFICIIVSVNVSGDIYTVDEYFIRTKLSETLSQYATFLRHIFDEILRSEMQIPTIRMEVAILSMHLVHEKRFKEIILARMEIFRE